MDHSRLEQLLEMLLYLSSGIKRSKAEVMERFAITERSFYRYIDTLRSVGFILPRPKQGLYHIDKASPYFKEIDELLHFSKEEAFILQKAIHSIDDENLLKQNLTQKLYALYDFNRVAHTIVKKENSEHIHLLMQAIKQKRKVILCDYKSAHSDKVSDRIVEPFDFTTNYMATWAYESSSGECKTFRNTRYARVKLMDEAWTNEAQHKSLPMDVFRFSSEQRLAVKIKMTMRAAGFLKEEYPLSEAYLRALGDSEFLFEADVCSYEGVGRFVLGLPSDTTVLGSEEFLSFLRKKQKKF